MLDVIAQHIFTTMNINIESCEGKVTKITPEALANNVILKESSGQHNSSLKVRISPKIHNRFHHRYRSKSGNSQESMTEPEEDDILPTSLNELYNTKNMMKEYKEFNDQDKMEVENIMENITMNNETKEQVLTTTRIPRLKSMGTSHN